MPARAGADEVGVEGVWARANAPGVPRAAVYLQLLNPSGSEARLVGAASPAAARVQIHRSVVEDGQSRMVHQKDGVAIPPDGEREFAPGGLHIMLMGLAERLEAGETLPLTLEFADGSQRRLRVPIKPLTWSPPGD